MRTILYCRVSTMDQTNDNQVLQAAARFPGAEIRTETASGIKDRPVLEALTIDLQAGDTLVVAALDRLGRRTVDVISRLELLLGRGVRIESLREGTVSNGATGKFLVSIMASFAEMERTLISERTKQALASRKAKGIRLGRPRRQIDQEALCALYRRGVSFRDIAHTLDIPLTTVCRRIKSLIVL